MARNNYKIFILMDYNVIKCYLKFILDVDNLMYKQKFFV